MKKLIAILTIAIVLVGAVFADGPAANDSAQLVVNAEIKVQYPAYSVAATSFGTYGQGTNGSLGSAAAVATTAGTSTVKIGDDVLLDHDATVTFTISQTTLSRIRGTYTLGVSATDLILTHTRNSSGQAVEATTAEANANHFAVSAAPTIAKGGANGADPTNTTENVGTAGQIAITYNGKKVAASTTIGTFSYTWTHNENNAAGDYQATVTLTITSIT